MTTAQHPKFATGAPDAVPTFREARAEASKSYLRSVLDEAGENVTQAARVAGVTRQHFYELLRRYGIELRRSMHQPGGNSQWRELGS